MRIRMLHTHRGSEDGFLVQVFYADQEYDVGDMLGRYFIRKGWAVAA